MICVVMDIWKGYCVTCLFIILWYLFLSLSRDISSFIIPSCKWRQMIWILDEFKSQWLILVHELRVTWAPTLRFCTSKTLMGLRSPIGMRWHKGGFDYVGFVMFLTLLLSCDNQGCEGFDNCRILCKGCVLNHLICYSTHQILCHLAMQWLCPLYLICISTHSIVMSWVSRSISSWPLVIINSLSCLCFIVPFSLSFTNQPNQ